MTSSKRWPQKKKGLPVTNVVSHQELRLRRFDRDVTRLLERWSGAQFSKRLWAHDPTLWIADPERAAKAPDLTNRLGWLALPEQMTSAIGSLETFADDVRKSGLPDVVLLGMGGSSLAPETLMKTFSNAPGYPKLTVLDSTHPAAIRDIEQRLDLRRTLFLVSSKSGSTLETASLFNYFYERCQHVSEHAGKHFVAITDPGSSLEALAQKRAFRHVFPGIPEVGGRYSALTFFGLVPAALIGLNMKKFLGRAHAMMNASNESTPVSENPGLVLGATLGTLARAGCDKLTLLASPSISSFGAWIEQLIAESTGKGGKGILPVIEEHVEPIDHYGNDRLFVYSRLEGDDNSELDAAATELETAGHPLVRIHLREKECLGGEFYRWEIATAAAGAALEINPFDQPDVESAKVFARKAMKAFETAGRLPAEMPIFENTEIAIYQSPNDSQKESAADNPQALVSKFLAQANNRNYVALAAYLPQTDRTATEMLSKIHSTLRNRLPIPVTLGYGPRFLHSTGQLHKGGNRGGLFIQITNAIQDDLPVPETPYTFGTLISAQAAGDYQALIQAKREVLRIHLKGDLPKSIEKLDILVME